MAAEILEVGTQSLAAAATTQSGQLAAAAAPWAGGDVTVRVMAGPVIAEVGTYEQWEFDSEDPRGMNLGPIKASTVNVSGATITSFVFVQGSTAILSVPASDITLDSATTQTGRRTSLADEARTKLRITANPSLPLATTYLLTLSLDDAGTVDVEAAGSLINTGTGACAWSITPPTHVTVTPSSGTLAAGGTQALAVESDTAGTYTLTVVSAGATIAANGQSIVISPPNATALTLYVPPSAEAGTEVTVTVTPNGPIPAGGGTATITPSAGTLGDATLDFTAGATAAQTTTFELASAGSATLTMTNDMGLTNSGSPASFTATPAVDTFSSVALVTTNSSPPLDTPNQWVVLSLHGSGTDYDLFHGRKYTADLPAGLSYETDNQFKFAIQNSTSGSTPTQMTILPSDRQENLPSGQRREMFWMGCNATPGAGNPVDMVMERRLDTLMAWFDANYPQGSTTRRVAVGGSMGAYGLMTYALKRPTKFAALYPDRTRWRSASTPNTIWVPAWSTGATNVYPFGAGPSARAEDGGFTLESHQDHLSWIANTANELPWIGWCIGSADEGTPFSDHIAAIAALRARGAGFAVYWNAGNHSVGARMNFEIYPTYPVYLWELGKGYPIFTEHSLDDDPTVDAEGGINIGLSFRNVVETTTTWTCEVRHQGTTFKPAQACTVKVKPKSWIYTGNPTPQLVSLPAAGAWTSVSF